MRKVAFLVAAATLTVGLGSGSSRAAVWFVDPEIGTDVGNTTCGQSLATPSTGPCATLNNALSHAAPGDEISIEKDGSFPPIYLNANIAINGPEDRAVHISWIPGTLPGCIGGAPGSCNGSANALYAVDIQAGGSDSIRLKNLILSNSSGGAANGALHFGAGFNLTMYKVTVRGGSSSSLAQMMLINPSTVGPNGQVQLFMSRCDVGFSSSGGGILVQPSGATPVFVHLLNSEIHNAKFGAKFDSSQLSSGQIAVAIDNSEFFSFNGSAVASIGTGSGLSHVSLARSDILDAGQYAVQSNGANSGFVLFENVISGNNIGVNVQSSGGVVTMSNNQIYANGFNCAVAGVNTACSTVLSPQSLQ
jgi:hypothetical protein